MLDLKTLNDVMLKVTGRGSKEAMLWQDAGGAWKPITSAELYGRIRAFADALRGLGVAKGDRVMLLSENRWEWAVTDLATMAIGAVDVPLYGTLTPEELGYSMRDSGAKVAVFSTKEQYEKLSKAGELPALEHVVVMDEGDYPGSESFSALMVGAEGKQGRDEGFDAAAKEVGPDDLATIIYTSGTTGQPKGVMLTHGNVASNLNLSTAPFHFKDTDSSISYLPLSHVTARHLDYAMMAQGIRVAYCPKFDGMAAAMKAVKPTIFVGVPRVYEKIRQAVEGKSAHSPVKKKILEWALKTGSGHRQETLEGTVPGGLGWTIANKLVYSKIREAFGGCVHTWVSGGAPLGMDTAGWYADVGIRIFEGYGLTGDLAGDFLELPAGAQDRNGGEGALECGGAVCSGWRVGGEGTFHLSWLLQKEKETVESFTEDGFFKTGGHREFRWRISLDHGPEERAAEDKRRQADRAATGGEQVEGQHVGGAGGHGRR